MGLCRRDALCRRVDAGDGCAEPRQRLAHETPAATDLEHAQAGKARRPSRVALEPPAKLVADIGQPHRIDAVELAEGAALVPPLPAEPREAGDLLAVEGRRVMGGMGHRALTVALNPLSRMAREGEVRLRPGPAVSM